MSLLHAGTIPQTDDETAAAQRLAKTWLEKFLAEIGAAPIAAAPPKSITDFCKSRGMSRAFFYALKRRKLAPKLDEIILPGEPGVNRGRGLRLVRISAESERAWDKQMEQLRATKAAELEVERARAQQVVAGKLAAESAAHVSKRTVKRRRSRRT
jgi:hypothetical protein